MSLDGPQSIEGEDSNAKFALQFSFRRKTHGGCDASSKNDPWSSGIG
jgi:hypothetical protein